MCTHTFYSFCVLFLSLARSNFITRSIYRCIDGCLCLTDFRHIVFVFACIWFTNANATHAHIQTTLLSLCLVLSLFDPCHFAYSFNWMRSCMNSYEKRNAHLTIHFDSYISCAAHIERKLNISLFLSITLRVSVWVFVDKRTSLNHVTLRFWWTEREEKHNKQPKTRYKRPRHKSLPLLSSSSSSLPPYYCLILILIARG